MIKNLLLGFLDDADDGENEAKDVCLLDYLQFDLNNKIYSFGGHFKNPNERQFIFRKALKGLFLDFIMHTYTFVHALKSNKPKQNLILSSAYFNLEKKLGAENLVVIRPPWVFGRGQQFYNYSLFKKASKIKKLLEKADFKTLLKPEFKQLVDTYKEEFELFVNNYKVSALFLPQDIGFFEKLAIDVLKRMNIPTFSFIHGLPGLYNKTDYNRTDYLAVWGEKIKQNFVDAGLNADKIIVNGHPKYKIGQDSALRFNFDNVLVLTKSLNGSQFSEEVVIADRSNLVYYLLSIKKALIKLGVKQVRLRPHPSENAEWYYKFIDRNFFSPDDSDLSASLTKSTLVIGPTSTLFLEALVAGVNYLVYEPVFDRRLVDGFVAVPPFDGSDAKVPVATSEGILVDFLENKKTVDRSVLDDYISSEFNSGAILDKINKHAC